MAVYAYETSVLSMYSNKLDETRNAVRGIYVREGFGGQLRFIESPKDGVHAPVFMLIPGPNEVPPFAHPLDVDLFNDKERKVLVVDMRNYVRAQPDGEVKITSELDYVTQRNRAFANLIYAKEPNDLFTLGNLPMTVYLRWIGDAIGARLGLPPETQVRLTVLIGYFYCMQYMDLGGKLDERERIKISQMISKSSFIPVELAMRVMDSLPDELYQPDARGLLSLLSEHGESVRYEQLNIGLFYSILYMGSWFGSNKNEIIALAVEHPPTFIGMMIAACEERGYKKTILGDLIKRNDRNGAADNLIKVFWSQPALK